MPLCRSPLQAFTVVAVFNSMTFALKVTPLAVRALSEGAVAVKRFQVRKNNPKNGTNIPFSNTKHGCWFSLLLSRCFLLDDPSSCFICSSQLASPLLVHKNTPFGFVLR